MTLSVDPLREIPANVQLREADAAECLIGGFTSLQAIAWSASESLHSYVAKWDGEPFAFWGYAPTSVLGHSCMAWMLTTPLADAHPISFARLSRRLFHTLRSKWPDVLVAVDPGHELAIKWLEWLGFNPHTTCGPLLIMRSNKG